MSESTNSTETNLLDLRGVACPMNFVKTRLFLDKLPDNSVVKVLLDAGEPVDSVCASVQTEGHQITECCQHTQGHYEVSIRKAPPETLTNNPKS